jgi:hypothetical protein
MRVRGDMLALYRVAISEYFAYAEAMNVNVFDNTRLRLMQLEYVMVLFLSGIKFGGDPRKRDAYIGCHRG